MSLFEYPIKTARPEPWRRYLWRTIRQAFTR